MPASVRSPASAAIDSGNITVTKPAGAVDGDLLLAVCFADPDGAAVGAPAGWTQVGLTHAPTGRGFGTVYRKAASGEGASYVFPGSGGSSNSVMIVAVTGHDAATPIDVAATWGDGGNATSHVAPSVSPTGSDSLLVCGWYGLVSGLTASYTPPGDMAERADLQPAGRWIVTSLATRGLAASGATGTRTATCTANRQYIGVSVAVKSAGGGSTVNGTAAASFAFTATASGTRTVQATAGATLAFATTAAGTRTASGTAASTFPFAASATGTVSTPAGQVSGVAAAALSFAAAASGGRTVPGVAVTSLGFASSALGQVAGGPATVVGSAAATLAFASAATGVRVVLGQASGPFSFAAAALGAPSRLGLAASVFAFEAVAAGVVSTPGSVIVRPSTGAVARPGGGLVARPLTGLVARPGSGAVVRPDTGVVSRP